MGARRTAAQFEARLDADRHADDVYSYRRIVDRSHPADIPRSLPFVRVRHWPRTHCDLPFLYDVVRLRTLRPAFQAEMPSSILVARSAK
jgi:hypothetical protein